MQTHSRGKTKAEQKHKVVSYVLNPIFNVKKRFFSLKKSPQSLTDNQNSVNIKTEFINIYQHYLYEIEVFDVI